MVSTPPCHGGRGVRVPRSRLNVVKITLLKEDLQQIKTTKNQLVRDLRVANIEYALALKVDGEEFPADETEEQFNSIQMSYYDKLIV